MLKVREPCSPGVQESHQSLCSATGFLVGSGTRSLQCDFLGLNHVFPAVPPQATCVPTLQTTYTFTWFCTFQRASPALKDCVPVSLPILRAMGRWLVTTTGKHTLTNIIWPNLHPQTVLALPSIPQDILLVFAKVVLILFSLCHLMCQEQDVHQGGSRRCGFSAIL